MACPMYNSRPIDYNGAKKFLSPIDAVTPEYNILLCGDGGVSKPTVLRVI